MSEAIHPSMPQAILPLRSDPTTLTRRSLELSPTRSSVRSSSSQSQAYTPASSVQDTPLFPTRPPSPERRLVHAADPNSFLTALAAQERRVLELREELDKANEDLEKLKKQWAVHEATKKKDDLRHLQQLQLLNNSLLGSSIPSGGYESAHPCRDMHRRRITSSRIMNSHRKVFTGSRHTRTLSLLTSKDPGSRSDLLIHGNEPSQVDQTSATDIAVPATGPESASLNVESGSQKDVIMETGKQLVGDFRQGLWTFFEDFKQLTVGDEGNGTTGLRRSFTQKSGNMPRRQNTKEKRTMFKGNLGCKSGAVDVVREPWRKPQVQTSNHNQRVGRALDRFTEVVVPALTPAEAKSGGENVIDFSNSDANAWDKDPPEGPTPR